MATPTTTSSTMQYVRFGKTGLRVSEMKLECYSIYMLNKDGGCSRYRVFALDACRMVPHLGIRGPWIAMNL